MSGRNAVNQAQQRRWTRTRYTKVMLVVRQLTRSAAAMQRYRGGAEEQPEII
jgi:hypothetical protein